MVGVRARVRQVSPCNGKRAGDVNDGVGGLGGLGGLGAGRLLVRHGGGSVSIQLPVHPPHFYS